MSDRAAYPIPARTQRVEEVIQRSRFITSLAHAPDAPAAHSFVDRVRVEFPDATHHCWAFLAGAPGSTASIGMSDSGEPHGTAGRPMLTVLLHSGVGEICAVGSRYYGGTKLGTGGLARAYAGGVKLALEELLTEVRTPRCRIPVDVGYPHVDSVRRLSEDMDAQVLSEEYGESVRYLLAVPTARLEEFERRLANLTRGEARMG